MVSGRWLVVSKVAGWLQVSGHSPMITDNWCWRRGGGICVIGVMLGSRRVMGWRGVIGGITQCGR